MKESSAIYVVRVTDDTETYEYEYGNEIHARELYNKEKNAILLKYEDGEDTIIDQK